MKEFGVLVSFIFILVCSGSITNAQNVYKVCAKIGMFDNCQQISRTEKLECSYNFNNLDCLMNVSSGKTSFGSVNAEEALLASKFLKNVVVLGEFRPTDATGDDSAFETVVLVNATKYTGGFSGLKGAKYCHPGFGHDQYITDYVLKEFELEVIKANSLDVCSAQTDTSTLFEKHLKTISDFFGPSCRPKSYYVVYKEFNDKIVNNGKYSSLCELCPKECDKVDNDPFEKSLMCLTQNKADVAFMTYKTVRSVLDKNTDFLNGYGYLCKNGTVVNSINNPCFWSKQPWQLLIANNDIKENLFADLKQWLRTKSIVPEASPFSSDSEDVLGSQLEHLMEILLASESKSRKVKFLNEPLNMTDYMNQFRTVPSAQEAVKCNTTMNWCTISTQEQEKCNWLSQAAANKDIQPIVNCTQREDKLTCFNELKKKNVDVLQIDTKYGYLARNHSLSPLAYASTDNRNLTTVMIVVKNNNTSDIKSIDSLKGKTSCFPEYRGIEWLAFAKTLATVKNCDLEQIVTDFVGSSCMPGAHASDHTGKSENSFNDKLCGLCRTDPAKLAATDKTCDTGSNNLYSGNAGALRCLQAAGDFAVITKNDYGVNESEFRVLCKNGSLAVNAGFNVEENCTLTSIINSEIIFNNNSNPKANDFEIAISEFEKWFGSESIKPFEIFNIFNGTRDLLFKDSTPGLEKLTVTKSSIVKYKDLVSETCNSSAATLAFLGYRFSIYYIFIMLSARLIL